MPADHVFDHKVQRGKHQRTDQHQPQRDHRAVKQRLLKKLLGHHADEDIRFRVHQPQVVLKQRLMHLGKHSFKPERADIARNAVYQQHHDADRSQQADQLGHIAAFIKLRRRPCCGNRQRRGDIQIGFAHAAGISRQRAHIAHMLLFLFIQDIRLRIGFPAHERRHLPRKRSLLLGCKPDVFRDSRIRLRIVFRLQILRHRRAGHAAVKILIRRHLVDRAAHRAQRRKQHSHKDQNAGDDRKFFHCFSSENQKNPPPMGRVPEGRVRSPSAGGFPSAYHAEAQDLIRHACGMPPSPGNSYSRACAPYDSRHFASPFAPTGCVRL